MKCHIPCEKIDLDDMREIQKTKINNICNILVSGVLHDKYKQLSEKKLTHEEIDIVWNFNQD